VLNKNEVEIEKRVEINENNIPRFSIPIFIPDVPPTEKIMASALFLL
jgi:hypothetical protein